MDFLDMVGQPMQWPVLGILTELWIAFQLRQYRLFQFVEVDVLRPADFLHRASTLAAEVDAVAGKRSRRTIILGHDRADGPFLGDVHERPVLFGWWQSNRRIEP